MNQRVPADLVLLRTSKSSGTCFIRTDQLDGETDWTLRIAVPECQKLDEGDLVRLDAEIYGMSFFTDSTCKLWTDDLRVALGQQAVGEKLLARGVAEERQ
jgi:magnesium-transporting ATPase (P-type)